MRRLLSSLLAVPLAALVACGDNTVPPPKVATPTAAASKKSTADQRESVGITVYNSDFGLVREIRNVDLGQGVVSLEFRDVSSRIEPQTVHVRSTTPGALSIFEQNYRFDLLTPQKLLEKYEGKKVKVYRYNEATGREDAFDAEVLSVRDGTVLRIGNEITYGFPGRFSFPEVPANLIAKPSLVWLLQSGQPRQKVEVTYLTRGINWRADYVFVLGDDDKSGDLTGWVTLTNQTGTSYENAQLKLVAGDVQRVQAYGDTTTVATATAAPAPAPPPPREFKEEGFFEYHLYTLNQPTSVLDNEQKQVTLLEGHDVKVEKRLVFFGNDYYYRGQYGQVATNQKVGVFLDVQNKESNHLGMPLPKGIVRVYKADRSGAKQFIGEDNIDHTSRDEKVRIKMGEAFDVVGDRKQTSFQVFGSCSSDSEWEIALRNHKDGVEEVEIVEPMGGDWEILASTGATPVKKDAHTLTFTVKVPARGEAKVTYKARVRWC